eukprot:12408625-Karenia_brevis.AAC.1
MERDFFLLHRAPMHTLIYRYTYIDYLAAFFSRKQPLHSNVDGIYFPRLGNFPQPVILKFNVAEVAGQRKRKEYPVRILLKVHEILAWCTTDQAVERRGK